MLVTLVTTASAPATGLRRIAATLAEACPEVVGITWSPSGGEQFEERTPGWRSSFVQQQALLTGRPFLVQHLCGERFEVVPDAFIRPNLSLTDALCRAVLDLSDVRAGDTVGTLSAARAFSRCCLLGAVGAWSPSIGQSRGLRRCKGTWRRTACSRV